MEMIGVRLQVAGVAQHELQHLRILRLVDIAQLIAHVAEVIGAQLTTVDVEDCRGQLLAILPFLVQQRRAEGDRPKDVDHRLVVRQRGVPLSGQAAHSREGALRIGLR